MSEAAALRPVEDDPPRCTAHNRRGEPCRKFPIAGGFVCSVHGGRAIQVKRAAGRRLAEAVARQQLAELDVEPLGSPLQELLDLAAREKAIERWFAAKVSALDPSSLRFQSDHGLEQLRAELALWERARDRLGRWLESLVRLGLDERKVRLNEAQGRLIVNLIEALLDGLNLSTDQQRVAPGLVRGLLLEASAAEIERAS